MKKRAMFARSADELAGWHGIEKRWEVQEPQVPAGVLGAEPLTFPHSRAAGAQNRAMFARSADEPARPHGSEKKAGSAKAKQRNPPAGGA